MKKHPILTGTLILSAAGFLSRLIGFLYRIYLSRTFGAQAVGVLQMTAPVTAMVMAVSCSGIQTALSKRIAELDDSQQRLKKSYLLASLFISVSISTILALFIRHYSSALANGYLQEAQTEALLNILAISFPLSAVHSCFAGYWLGQQKAKMPAFCQLFEQLVRVTTVIFLCEFSKAGGSAVSLRFAVIGSAAGEFVAVCACLFCAIFGGSNSLQISKREYLQPEHSHTPIVSHMEHLQPFRFCMRNLFSMAAPLSLNRLSLNFLQSVEAVRIPLSLRLYGCTDAEALTIYGILTGIALPVLFFPGAFIGPFSQMLLPTVSQAHSRKEYGRIRTIMINTSFILVFLGVFCSLALFLFADFLGNVIFQEPLAAGYIRSLCLLCPLLYLNQVLSGILQGLGDAFGVFFINTFSVFLRLCFVFFSIPQIGIRGYFYGLLFAQLSAAVFFCV
ncbi:MAG: oligosaccharide flippase family protein [Lachnospiraceae bacterium]|nr:oligosaccharide flippase family protein [Lachnospiraceae bacterium]